MRKSIAVGMAAALVGVLPLLQGCGGGGGGGSSTPTRSAVKTTINWPARSKAVNALSSALSARITVALPGPGAVLDTFVVNRHDDPAAYSETVVSPNQITPPSTAVNAVIDFFADKNGAGGAVGEASQSVNVKSDGTLAGSNGQEAGFSVTGTIATVEVTPGQVLALGDTKSLTFTAKASDGTVIPVSDGSATFALTDGGAALDLSSSGLAHAKAVGTAMATATVDGKASAPTAVTVNYGIASLEIPANQSVNVGATNAVQVTAKKADGTVLTLPAGVVTFALSTGADLATLTPAGQLSGVAVGTATLVATGEGVTSAAQRVTINPGAIVTTGDGLQYQELVLSNDPAQATAGKTVHVIYVGALTDGTVFDSGNFSFIIDSGQVIPGFNEGVKGMHQGEKRHLIIPANLAYGTHPPPGSGIPVNATLVFDVTVDHIQ